VVVKNITSIVAIAGKTREFKSIKSEGEHVISPVETAVGWVYVKEAPMFEGAQRNIKQTEVREFRCFFRHSPCCYDPIAIC
jgi:hypothetical protein